jgi:hypothetical protein
MAKDRAPCKKTIGVGFIRRLRLHDLYEPLRLQVV